MARAPHYRELPPRAQAAIQRWERKAGMSLSKRAYPPLARLFWAGCNPVAILKLLRAYCPPADVQNRRRTIEFERKKARRTITLLRDLAATVEQYHKRFLLPLDLPQEMHDFADSLERFYVGDRVFPGDLGTVLGRGGGRQLYLYTACTAVKAITGMPHYREIAEIVNVLSGSTEDEVSIRKTVTRFRGWWMYDLPNPDIATQAVKRRVR